MGGTPETRYARDGDRYIAYQVVGERGPDLLYVPIALWPIDLIWDEPTVARHLYRLASFSRVILTDILGAGSSDVVRSEDPAMQSWTDGLIAVLDAIGSERASIIAMSGSALPAALLAATYPDRVRSLILWSPWARYIRAPDHRIGLPETLLDEVLDDFEQRIGTGANIDRYAPSWADDAAKRRWWARCERLEGTPGYFRWMLEVFLRTDLRPVLETISAPTLVMGRRSARDVSIGHAKDVAERISNSRYVEFDGDDLEWLAGDADSVLDEIESFLTGTRGATTSNRVLATVLFTDIVGSTERATQLGDSAWAAVLARHDHLVERHVAAARGVVVKATGDGILATFDGPARAVECATGIRDAVEGLGLSIRAGLHTGEIEKADGDIHGIAVHIAARIMALAGPGEVLVSGVMPPLVLGSRLEFADRGEHSLKGVPGSWRVLAVD
ncbi:adenylate/guanylate cyclase domain-containing protein [Mycolicibacterium tusciae]|uniref:Cyclase n=1 Tax=Mycolicibacterium tusciae TaxID=75922 RepID=A0A1X0JYR3_9MYCO|nr:adenylate/guanylate cyclase domain-containing protein [Mycolicibacterium tusciae]ORB67961.1 cyclase [Mycolicibacterium tusciae]